LDYVGRRYLSSQVERSSCGKEIVKDQQTGGQSPSHRPVVDRLRKIALRGLPLQKLREQLHLQQMQLWRLLMIFFGLTTLQGFSFQGRLSIIFISFAPALKCGWAFSLLGKIGMPNGRPNYFVQCSGAQEVATYTSGTTV
jgi:hypothetical protein